MSAWKRRDPLNACAPNEGLRELVCVGSCGLSTFHRALVLLRLFQCTQCGASQLSTRCEQAEVPPWAAELPQAPVSATRWSDDPVQLDLATVVARLRQIRRDGYDNGHWLLDRVITGDLQRLESHLSDEARAAVHAEELPAWALDLPRLWQGDQT